MTSDLEKPSPQNRQVVSTDSSLKITMLTVNVPKQVVEDVQNKPKKKTQELKFGLHEEVRLFNYELEV